MTKAALHPSPGHRHTSDPRPNLELVFAHSLEQDEALDRFVGGLTDMSGPCADTLEEVRAAPDGVDLVLHPAALPVEIRSLPGLLRASAFTLSLGPGYHAHVADALVAAAEQAGLRAAHDVIDSYLATTDLGGVEQACNAYWRACMSSDPTLTNGEPSGTARHVAIDGLRLQHPAPFLLPSGPFVPPDADTDPAAAVVPSEHALWWEPGLHDTMRLRRAAYSLRYLIPPRPPLDELEVGRMESLCDDLDALHQSSPEDPALLALRGPWRALLDALDGLRERPRHLSRVTPDDTLCLRRGPLWVRARRHAWLQLPSEMSIAWRGNGTFWAADEGVQLWLEVHPVELLPGEPAPPAHEVLDAVGEWGPDTQRDVDRFLEWERHEDAEALHAAVWLDGQVGLLTIQPQAAGRERAEALARGLCVSPR
ncbi:MAG: hypothetical protein H6725_16235 [Sandaracinaceae bacterium]|nr:hypothetical protein [Sandaracinaceae bacterium]